MNMILAIAAGGALGAVCRYGVNIGAIQLLGANFPWGTLIVNVLGSFIMGALIAAFAHIGNPSQEIKAFLIVGLLGAMTTFSTFSLDTITLFERGELTAMALYLFSSVFFSIMGLFAGLFLVRTVFA
ncbi:MAG: fluoride efflux transporter CrcB [Alphaproteobacteria bacterium]|nr:fluoride efflux transporter CrcB [Alphaproteobacteria bacterium]NCQ88822.1 fluoride efflux transporter CrcB [Alphaproteobacteria bacterium]NCT07255.1 fluoride efflux transporter CrcB [Alphaproteobacteria bacterium]